MIWQNSHSYKLCTHKLYKATAALAIIALILSSGIYIQSCKASEEQNTCDRTWNELTPDRQYSISQSLRFYRLKADNGSLAALAVLDLNDRKFILKPFFNQKNTSVSKAMKEQKGLAGINGGYFNLSNGDSTSYVVIDSKNQYEPRQNKALIENPDLKPYLETIFNRSELRILEDSKNKRQAFINLHLDPIPAGWTLLHSIQAGPRLLPKIYDKEEAFTRKTADDKIVDSIGVKKKAARTAIGITHDNHVLLLCVANKNQDEFSSGVTLEELAQMLRNLGCDQAINLDGGTSTTMCITEGDTRDELNYSVVKVISTDPEKLVKSGLLVEKNVNRSHSRYSTDFFPH